MPQLYGNSRAIDRLYSNLYSRLKSAFINYKIDIGQIGVIFSVYGQALGLVVETVNTPLSKVT